MPVEVSNIFTPRSQSIQFTLAAGANAFFIPDYQRPYRWSEESVRRLFESVEDGVQRFSEYELDQSVTFIGAIITLDEINQDNQMAAPEGACTVIDGQQRLTTIALIMMAAHELLREIGHGLEGSAEQMGWTPSVVQGVERLIECASGEAEAVFAYRAVPFNALPKPRIVRERIDRWAAQEAHSLYRSPIARLLSSYIASLDRDEVFEVPEGTPELNTYERSFGAEREDYKTISDRFAELRELVRRVYESARHPGDDDAALDALTTVQTILRSNDRVRELFGGHIDELDNLRDELVESVERDEELLGIMRLLVLLSYTQRMVALTTISVSELSYAFDLFDSLNTSGEALTALETFIPQVVQDLEEATDDAARECLEEGLLALHRVRAMDSRWKQLGRARMGRFLTVYAQGESGLKLSEALNEQRKWLRSAYARQPVSGRVKMIEGMETTALAFFAGLMNRWRPLLGGYGGEKPLPDIGDEAEFMVGFLANLDHTTTVPAVSRYLGLALEDPTPENANQVSEAILAIGAFSLVWRAASGGGANLIDSRYGWLMKGDDNRMGLSRLDQEGAERAEVLSLDELRGTLVTWISEKYGVPTVNRQWWMEQVKRMELGRHKEIASALLFLSHHRSSWTNEGALVTAVAAPNNEFLHSEVWRDKAFEELEHIAPQGIPDELGGFDDGFYPAGVSGQSINALGNLVLIPGPINASLGNRSWNQKRAIYSALASDTVEEAKACLEGVPDVSDQTRKTLENEDNLRQMPMVREVANWGDAWTVDVVQARTEQILSRAWNEFLGPWLGID